MTRKAVLAVVPALLMAVVPSAEARAPIVAYQQQTTGQLRLYDAETGLNSAGPPLPTNLDYGFRRVTVSPNGRFMVYRRDGKVRLFDRATAVELRIPNLGTGSFLTVTNDGNRIAYDGNSNSPTSVYDRALGRFLTNAEAGLVEVGGENLLRQPVFSADGRFLVGTEFGCISGDDSDTCLYEVGVGKVTIPEIDADDEDPCIDGDGSVLAVTAPTGVNQPHDLFVLDPAPGATAFTTPPAVATPNSDERFCFLDSSGRYVAYRDATAVASLYDRQAAGFLPLPDDVAAFAGLADPYVPPAPTGPRKPVAAYLDAGGDVKLWDTHTDEQLPDPGVTVPGVIKRWSLSHDGRFIVWVEQDADPAIHLFDRETDSERALPGIDTATSGSADRPGSLTVSDTGLVGFDRNANGPSRVYDAAAGDFLDTGLAAANGHTHARLSADGRFLATNCLNSCEVTLDGNDNTFVQDLTTKSDTGFPENLTGSNDRDQQQPCVDGDGSRVGVHAAPAGQTQKDVYLYDRSTSALVPLPPGVNATAVSDMSCRLDPSGQYLGISDQTTAAFRVYSVFHDGFLLLPPDASNPLSDVWLSSRYPPPVIPPPDGGGAGSAAPSTGGTGAGGGGLDADPPGLTLRGARSQRLGPRGQVRVTAILDEAGAIAGSGTVTTSGASRTFRLQGTRRTLRVPGTVVLKLRLSKRRLREVRRALRRGLRARAHIRITARDPAGNSTAARRTIRLRPR